MKGTNTFFSALFITVILSCNEIFEPSLTDRQVKLLAPHNNYISASYEITFWFETVKDAQAYRLQVVSPDFDSIGTLIADTLLRVNRFSVSVAPGIYQWRVRAENGSSETKFSELRTFTIAVSSIKQQRVILLSPSNQLLTNNSSVTLKWQYLYGANQYRIQMDTNNFDDENTLLLNRLGSSSELSYTFLKDKVYKWRVRAENDTATSLWSSINHIIFDHTPPPAVQMIAPSKGAVAGLPVLLRWNTLPSVKKYKLYVYKADSTSLYDQKFPLVLGTSSYSFNQGAGNDKIYWKVSPIDDAGNEGPTGELRNFILQ